MYERPEVRRLGGRLALAQATGVVASLTVVSKIFGFVREAAMAKGFGATAATDAYLVAFTIPTVLFAAGAALGLAFIPVYAEVYEREGPGPANQTAGTVLNVTVLLGCLVVAVGYLSIGPLVRLSAPGFGGEVYLLTVRLTRYMLPVTVFQALSVLLAGMLQTQGNFAIPAAVTVLFNLVVISSIVALGPAFGIEAVALGTTIAVVLQALVQLTVLRIRGFQWPLRVAWGDPRLRRWVAIAIPVIASSAAGQVSVLIERMLASRLTEGSISALNYAQRLVALPQGVIGTAIAIVLLPALSRYAAAEESQEFRAALAGGLQAMFFVLVPVTVLTMVLREPIVRLAFGRGAFDQVAVEATSCALLFLALGIVGFSMADVLTRAFYARQDMRTVMVVVLSTTAIGVALRIALVRPLGHLGLAVALVLTAWLGACAMFLLLATRLGRPFARRVLKSLGRVAAAAAPMALLTLLTARMFTVAFAGGRMVFQVSGLACITLLGMALYWRMAVLLRVPEGYLVEALMGRMSCRAFSTVVSVSEAVGRFWRGRSDDRP
ncbi:MAG: murein biosynthesis integral membrane protein MurJ [bacterium]|nr:murein biosynthesis integral membrane protein MurJ [bacterium]